MCLGGKAGFYAGNCVISQEQSRCLTSAVIAAGRFVEIHDRSSRLPLLRGYLIRIELHYAQGGLGGRGV